MVKIVDSQGRVIQLGARLGHGGEGDVFPVISDPALVAKLYHAGKADGKREKVLAMAQSGTDERLIKFAAWPVEPLFDGNRSFAGFLMRRIEGFRQAHDLYSPKSRRSAFPTANWPFLVHTSLNIAKAFATVHERGHVIGDVNHGNVLVSTKATAMLIDCDSFQIRRNGSIFRCEVGVSTYTPPELQGKTFSTIDRTANHDNFGLAVLIFHMLFMGRHPFAGRFFGSEEMPIEKAIGRYLFAYANDSQFRGMTPPPNTLSLQCVSPQLSSLLERAFASTGNARPTALSWVTALSEMAGELKKCSVDPAHDHLKSLSRCPWCEIEKRTGVMLFGIAPLDGAIHPGVFQLQLVWSQISAVTAPSPAPLGPTQSTLGIEKPKRPMDKTRLAYLLRRAAGIGLILLGVPALVWTGNFVVPAVLALIGYLLMKADPGGFVADAECRIKTAEARIAAMHADWNRKAGTRRFEDKLRELEGLKTSYEGLPAERVRRMKQLEGNRRADQLRNYLDAHYIRDAKISGIGSGRVTMLESYGIETAADITLEAVDAVPGFGTKTTLKLIAWKGMVEQRFVFNASSPVDHHKIQKVETDISHQKQEIENRLRAGTSELVAAKNEVQVIRIHLTEALRKAYAELVDAKSLLSWM